MIFQATSPIEVGIQYLDKLGFFSFILPYMITVAIFYGLLRKSQIFGDPDRNVAVNAIVASGAALLVWAAPILLGIDIKTQLSAFVLQSVSIIFTFIVGTLILSMFVGPDLPAKLSELMGDKKWAFYMSLAILSLILGFGILFASGLYKVFFIFLPGGTSGNIFSSEIVSLIITLAFIVIIVLIFAYIK